MAKSKSAAIQIAEHFGADVADIREYNYQPGHWSRPVFAGFDGNRYWAGAGSKPSKHRDGDDDLLWEQVPSSWAGNPPLWRGVAA